MALEKMQMSAPLILILNMAATWYLVGLIWIVQVVHYPMFDRVGGNEFKRYEEDHNRLITPVVGVPMVIELVTAIALLAFAPIGFPKWAAWTGVGLIAVIWLSTAFIQVPCHTKLLSGFQVIAHQRLVHTNWIRTACWSARGVLLGYFLVRMFPASGP
tara:strand:+ start:26458 stop:26931 length:474 start_codon:yes stop_codon:yes gene_type:complete